MSNTNRPSWYGVPEGPRIAARSRSILQRRRSAAFGIKSTRRVRLVRPDHGAKCRQSDCGACAHVSMQMIRQPAVEQEQKSPGSKACLDSYARTQMVGSRPVRSDSHCCRILLANCLRDRRHPTTDQGHRAGERIVGTDSLAPALYMAVAECLPAQRMLVVSCRRQA